MNAQMMTYTLNSTVGCCDANTVSAGLKRRGFVQLSRITCWT